MRQLLICCQIAFIDIISTSFTNHDTICGWLHVQVGLQFSGKHREEGLDREDGIKSQQILSHQ